jgi:hypothetical protein
MTAEIAVMNQSAVALAADSAATRSEAKIFTANKIFALSKYRPVAVMIYGSSACMNVPWETIIKEFRAELGDKNCPTVGAYGDELFAFVAANRALFPESEQERFAYRYAADKFSRIKEDILAKVKTQIEAKGPLTKQQGSDVAQEVIDQRVDFWKNQPRRPKLPHFEQIITGISSMVVSELPADAAMQVIKDHLEENRTTVIGSLADKLGEKRHSLYVDPLLSIVSSLPMDELASLAESLVNLTSLRRRVSLDQESVGGPIDVAVISRGDGLVWIKRKHYFPGDLNQQFFANYFRS